MYVHYHTFCSFLHLQSILENLQDCQPVTGPPPVRLVPETLCHEIELWLYIAVKRALKDKPS